jgi:arginine decarboxylase
MTNTYFDLIDQTFYFPQEGFDLQDGNLTFHGVPIAYLIEKYGTPMKITYLPKIGMQIKRAKNLFNRAIKSKGYGGKYYYCYCTKTCHFSYVINEVLRHGVNLETSSAFDIDIIRSLHRKSKLDKDIIIVNNGFKTPDYARAILQLINDGFENVIPVLDNVDEHRLFEGELADGRPCKIGIRVATEEEPNFAFYTSRLGIRQSEVIPFYERELKDNPNFQLKMLHFFVDTGIKDSLYYWGELKKAVKLYCELKKICPDLRALNIGGGMPIRNSLGSEFDYKYMISEIVKLIGDACAEEGVEDPDIFTEFGKYTVGESGATIFSVIGQKKQNDSELWYMVDNSLMNTLPDSWGIGERFILLPINKWNNEYRRVNIGGLSCDNSDYYNSEVHESQVYLPAFPTDDPEPLYLGFFHTGAYQDSLSGYGGIKHCLIPSPQQIVIYKDSRGNLVDTQYQDIQKSADMLRILGYQD